jgi:hypothetical protein
MPRETRKQWVERVRQWGRSGLDAETFAKREGVCARTLIWWRWRLGMGPRAKPDATAVVSTAEHPAGVRARRSHAKPDAPTTVVSDTRREPTFVEVVLPEADSGHRVEQSGGALEFFVGRHRVLVPRGFDESTLRRLLSVLEGR